MISVIIPLRKKTFLFALMFVGITGLGFALTRPANAIDGLIPGPQPGSQAPDFTLQTIDGEFVTLSELRGRPVLVNIWASWCTPCKYEMPTIQKVYEEFKDRGLIVLAVNLTKKDDLTSVLSFIEEYDLTLTFLLDLDGQVEAAYQLRGLPTSFFIDRDGIVQSVVIGGPMPEQVVRASVEQIIAEE